MTESNTFLLVYGEAKYKSVTKAFQQQPLKVIYKL